MKNLKRALSCAALFASLNICAAEWSYKGNTGPKFWGDLSPEYTACKSGVEQSPIDLGTFAQTDKSLTKLKHQFKPVPLTVVNNGHTIQVNTDKNSFTKTEFGKQKLLQFHFHSPSENTLNGKHFPLEVHFVHTDDKGILSVVGVFYKEGDKNPALAKILNVAPDHKGTNSSEGNMIDPNNVLGSKKTKTYFRFSGSLTTPPCTEGVRWYVSKNIQSVSAAQIGKFKHLFHGGNSRPVQKLNARTLRTTKK
ncbi:carbonic anhydrase [Aliikangiella sp. IMCC44359]|uniref:carbonic anhydrase n=1 Tax=Aliikangiella sp. IMCC44359 TaxID=3459125 RepID=UPI00403AA46D